MFWCCCGCPATIWTFTVRSPCGNRVQAGATVTVTQGATTIGTCVTNGSGVCSISIPADGSYSASATLTGFGTGTASFTVTACASGSSTITLGYPSSTSCITALNDCLDYPFPALSGATVTDPIFGVLTYDAGTYPFIKTVEITLCAPCGGGPGEVAQDFDLKWGFHFDGSQCYLITYCLGHRCDNTPFDLCCDTDCTAIPLASDPGGGYASMVAWASWPLYSYTLSPYSLTFGPAVSNQWPLPPDTCAKDIAENLYCASISGLYITLTW